MPRSTPRWLRRYRSQPCYSDRCVWLWNSSTYLWPKFPLKGIIYSSGLIIIDITLSAWELASSDVLHVLVLESSAKHWSTSQFRYGLGCLTGNYFCLCVELLLSGDLDRVLCSWATLLGCGSLGSWVNIDRCVGSIELSAHTHDYAYFRSN